VVVVELMAAAHLAQAVTVAEQQVQPMGQRLTLQLTQAVVVVVQVMELHPTAVAA
jgi:hypothetical protein